MSKALLIRSSLLVSFTLGFTGCTIHPADSAPPLTGPSGFGRSLTVTATPDNIAADGSQSAINATLLDASGAPMSGVPLQVSLSVSGTPTDFGSLSSRTVVTNSAGKATVVYYAPVKTGFFAGTPGSDVWVTLEPVGSDYQTVVSQHVALRVTPPPVPALDVDGPVAAVTYLPSAPKVGDNITFSATGSQASPGHAIVSYFWDFGDARPNDEHGDDASHAYAAAGTYIMVLGVTDEVGHSSNTFKTIVVTK